MSIPEILTSVLALPEEDRIVIADAILASLPEESEKFDDEALARELERRSENGDDDLMTWAQIKDMIARGELK